MSNKPVVVFEGIECSGKSLHVKNICKFLKKKGIPYICLREPGGSKNSEIIRKLILNKKSNFNRYTDLFLYSASRSENIKELKKFHKKRIIIIDRFTDSTIAYQHFGLGVDLNLIRKIHNVILNDFKIDFTFLNVVNETNMLQRLKKRNKLNRYDTFNVKFYKKVQKGFLTLAKKKPNKYKIINSNLDMKINKDIVLKKISELIK
tara:strand:+ start:308 stop:922 length:615 start_codon:yes stop_codon:yes gene_type:complete